MTTMTDQLTASPLCPETPVLPRKMIKAPRSPSRGSSDVLCLSRQLADPQLCDSCASCPETETASTRFSVSMVAHQLPCLDCPDDWDQLDVASLVAHMVTKLLGDESLLRQNYLNYIENFIHHSSPDQEDQQDHIFISSFLTHCLPLLSPDSDPALCHLITSLAAHLVGPESEQTSRPRSSEEVEGRMETPESLRSLETVNYFPSKHLLSNYSEGQLDRNFSLSSSSPEFSPSSLLTGINQHIKKL